MKKSLYAQYINERCGRGILETKDGFATFDYVNTDTVYIVDLFVTPNKRKSHVATSLADKIVEQALKDGKKYLLGSVDTTAKGAMESMKVLEAYGMTVCKVAEPMVFYGKEIKEELIVSESEVQCG